MKRTWKLRTLGHDRIREVLRTSRSLAEAASTLDVNRSTLHRWMEADKSLNAPRRERLAAVEQTVTAAGVLSPEAWARTVEQTCQPDGTARVLIDLARRALELARDEDARPAERLSAMGRFQSIVAGMRLSEPEAPTSERPRPVATEVRSDPRAVLRVVK